MSTSYSPVRHTTCCNDCVQTGCPGHAIRIVYHNTSDTLSIEIDGKREYTFDPHIFRAAMRAHQDYITEGK